MCVHTCTYDNVHATPVFATSLEFCLSLFRTCKHSEVPNCNACYKLIADTLLLMTNSFKLSPLKHRKARTTVSSTKFAHQLVRTQSQLKK